LSKNFEKGNNNLYEEVKTKNNQTLLILNSREDCFTSNFESNSQSSNKTNDEETKNELMSLLTNSKRYFLAISFIMLDAFKMLNHFWKIGSKNSNWILIQNFIKKEKRKRKRKNKRKLLLKRKLKKWSKEIENF